MIRVLVNVLVLHAVVNASPQTCVINPDELKWSNDKICNQTMEYPHDTIEKALMADAEKLAFVENAAEFYKPLPYQNVEECDAFLGTEQQYVKKKIECGSICPGKIVNLTTVWYDVVPGDRVMCIVIRPWQQVVYYTKCEVETPLVPRMSESFRCLQESPLKRRIAVYCPNIFPQCRFMNIELPQHCAASQLKCKKKPETKKLLIDSLFSNWGSNFF